MNEIEKIITIFRKRRDISSDKLLEALLAHGIEADLIQTIYQNESPSIFTFFQIDKLPMVLLFSDGEETKRLTTKEIEVNTLINFLS